MTVKKKFIIGSRGSKLSLAYSNHVKNLLIKSNSLFAKKMFNVKCNNTTKEEIAAAIPIPNFPYANKHIGIPIFPVFGKINVGNSLIKSFFKFSLKLISFFQWEVPGQFHFHK